MTDDQVWDLLTTAAAFDRRTAGKADKEAWLAALGDLRFEDCQAAVIAHYRESTDWLMPAHVRQRVKAMRRDRLERAVMPAPDPALTDSPHRYRAALLGMIGRMGDGFANRMAVTGPARQGPPPRRYLEAKAALPAAPSGSKQEAAAQQVAESRAERVADSPKEAS